MICHLGPSPRAPRAKLAWCVRDHLLWEWVWQGDHLTLSCGQIGEMLWSVPAISCQSQYYSYSELALGVEKSKGNLPPFCYFSLLWHSTLMYCSDINLGFKILLTVQNKVWDFHQSIFLYCPRICLCQGNHRTLLLQRASHTRWALE